MAKSDETADRGTDPQPERTTGLEVGSGVSPGETPPMADSMSGASPSVRRDSTPNMGPVVPNRTPMIITLVLIGLIVLLVLGYGIAEIGAYITKKPGEEQESMGALLTALGA